MQTPEVSRLAEQKTQQSSVPRQQLQELAVVLRVFAQFRRLSCVRPPTAVALGRPEYFVQTWLVLPMFRNGAAMRSIQPPAPIKPISPTRRSSSAPSSLQAPVESQHRGSTPPHESALRRACRDPATSC